MGSTTLAPCPHQLHLLRTIHPNLLHPNSIRTTSDGQGQLMSYMN